MWNFIWPILLVVISNAFYNVSTKSTPGSVQPFASLTVTYLVAAVSSGILYFVTSPVKNLFADYKNINWSSFALGIAIIGLEFGYIQMYRAGWTISTGSLLANAALAVVLIVIGAFFYHERITTNQMIGIALCLIGFFFINKK